MEISNLWTVNERVFGMILLTFVTHYNVLVKVSKHSQVQYQMFYFNYLQHVHLHATVCLVIGCTWLYMCHDNIRQ